jgi:hypothetical protein
MNELIIEITSFTHHVLLLFLVKKMTRMKIIPLQKKLSMIDKIEIEENLIGVQTLTSPLATSK